MKTQMQLLFLLLCIHAVGHASEKRTISIKEFNAQLKMLQSTRYTASQLRAMRECLENNCHESAHDGSENSDVDDMEDSSENTPDEDDKENNATPVKKVLKGYALVHTSESGKKVVASPFAVKQKGVYAYVASDEKTIDWNRVPPEYKTDVEAELKKIAHEEFEDEKERLYSVLLIAEQRLLTYLKANPSLMSESIYCGETIKTMVTRGKQHIGEIKRSNTQASVKANTFDVVYDLDRDLCQTSLFYSPPAEYNLIFEALGEHITRCREHGCSARIANTTVWKELEEYFKYPARIKKLTELDLINVVEDLNKKLLEHRFRYRK